MTSEIDRDFTRFLLHHSPLNGKGRHILTKWAESSLENRMFVLNNTSLFNFGDIFEDGNDFSIFTAMISQDVTETTDMKMLIQLQQDYMKSKIDVNNEPLASASSDPREANSAPKNNTEVPKEPGSGYCSGFCNFILRAIIGFPLLLSICFFLLSPGGTGMQLS